MDKLERKVLEITAKELKVKFDATTKDEKLVELVERTELEIKAKEMKIKFDATMSNDDLMTLVAIEMSKIRKANAILASASIADRQKAIDDDRRKIADYTESAKNAIHGKIADALFLSMFSETKKVVWYPNDQPEMTYTPQEIIGLTANGRDAKSFSSDEFRIDENCVVQFSIKYTLKEVESASEEGSSNPDDDIKLDENGKPTTEVRQAANDS